MSTEKLLIVNNKKAKFDFNIEETYLCGIKLMGHEVKSIKKGNVSIKESYCFIDEGILKIKNMYVKEYHNSPITNIDEYRIRELLLTKKEISNISKKIDIKGMAIIPTKLVLVDNFIKLEVGVGTGAKKYDKREKLKEKDHRREMKEH